MKQNTSEALDMKQPKLDDTSTVSQKKAFIKQAVGLEFFFY